MSRNDFVGIKLQKTGTPPLKTAATTPPAFFPAVTGFNMTPDRAVLDIAETMGNRLPSAADFGTKKFTGEMAGAARPDSFPAILSMFLGSPTTTTPVGGTTSKQHVYGAGTPVPGTIWAARKDPTPSIEDKVIGVLGNELAFTIEMDDYLLYRASLLGYDMIANPDTLTNTPDTTKKWPFHQVTAQLKVGAGALTALPLKAFGYSYNNNLIDDQGKLGSTQLDDIPLGNVETNVTLTVNPSTVTDFRLIDHYRRALQDNPTDCQLIVTAAGATALEAAIFPSLIIDLKRVHYREAPAPIDGGETLRDLQVTASAVQDDSGVLQALTVINANAGTNY